MNPVDLLIKKLGEMPKRKRNVALFLLNLPVIFDLLHFLFFGHTIGGTLGFVITILNILLLIMDIKIIYKYGGWWWANDDDE